jgi:uncharacterized protein (UPF0248 family)
MSQIHKTFSDQQVRDFLERYLNQQVDRKHLQEVLGIRKRRFFDLLKKYKEDPQNFTIRYQRGSRPKISKELEKTIVKELRKEQKIIQNPEIPLRTYNYSYIRDLLTDKYKQRVSLPTIIDRAKKNDFYLPKKQKKTIHDREVLTRYIGELIQHDSSYHLWSPAAKEKWYLITSLDDFSRYILYAALVKKESSWAHISALQSVILKYGCPFTYYVDSHSIFRFVQGRDSLWRNHYKQTDESTPQWKQVLEDCKVKVSYALSPQAKGKIERPYGWLQDRLVRSLVREEITDIKKAQPILNRELYRYNHRQIHSTTQEIPSLRFQRALKENQSLFRSFQISPPWISPKDIFCLRADRTIDAYRKISVNGLQIKINGAVPLEKVTLRIYPLNHLLSEVRFWSQKKLIDVQKFKNTDLFPMHF